MLETKKERKQERKKKAGKCQKLDSLQMITREKEREKESRKNSISSKLEINVPAFLFFLLWDNVSYISLHALNTMIHLEIATKSSVNHAVIVHDISFFEFDSRISTTCIIMRFRCKMCSSSFFAQWRFFDWWHFSAEEKSSFSIISRALYNACCVFWAFSSSFSLFREQH